MITNSTQNTRFRWQTAKKLESLAEEITDISDGNVEFGKNIEVNGTVTINSASDLVIKDGTTLGGKVVTININELPYAFTQQPLTPGTKDIVITAEQLNEVLNNDVEKVVLKYGDLKFTYNLSASETNEKRFSGYLNSPFLDQLQFIAGQNKITVTEVKLSNV